MDLEGSGTWKPHHLKSGQTTAILSKKQLKSGHKHLDFECSNFGMVETIARAKSGFQMVGIQIPLYILSPVIQMVVVNITFDFHPAVMAWR